MKSFSRSIVAFGAAIVCSAAVAAAQPKLEIKGGETFDWGVISNTAQPATAKIEIKNVGDKELIISEVKPGCGCTAAPLEKSNLKPGESTHMNITLNLGSNIGQIMKTVLIRSNSLPNNEQTLVLKAFIQRPIQIDPTFVSMGQMYANRAATGTAKMKNTTKAPITITGVTANNGVTVNIKTPFVLEAGKETELVVKVTPKQEQVGYFNAEILFQTNNPEQPSFDVRLYGDVKTLTPAQSPAFAPGAGDK